MLRRIRRSTVSILSLLITMPVLAHESLDHVLGYRHELHSSWEFASIVFAIAALVFIVGFFLKVKKNDSKK
ncbi:MAG: hypothetical protein NZ775_03105 [Gammaproteobacteria bacterium]|nr:hypothetical protein [Gammaproteobacteria bacterium]